MSASNGNLNYLSHIDLRCYNVHCYIRCCLCSFFIQQTLGKIAENTRVAVRILSLKLQAH